MNLLLDTHVFIWWLEESPRLAQSARAAIGVETNLIYVRVASAWEIAIKVGLGKLPEVSEILANFEEALQDEGFLLLPITVAHARNAGMMVGAHRDPFDRLLAAQALAEGLTLVTADTKLAGLGAAVLW